jgi:hypothetical protein
MCMGQMNSSFVLHRFVESKLIKLTFFVRLPDPCKDHAIVMARFARDILEKLNQLTHRLESTLGPDTGDLNMRIGK